MLRRAIASWRGLRANKALVRMLIGVLSFSTARPMQLVALTVIVFDLGGVGQVGAALVALAGTSGLASLLLSVVSAGRDPVMLTRAGLRLGLVGAIVAVVGAIVDGGSVPILVLGVSVADVGAILHRTGRLAVFPRLAPTIRELAAANVLAGLADGVGFLVGPLVAALLLGLVGSTPVFGVVVFLLIIGTIANHGVRVAGSADVADASGGLAVVLRDQWQSLSSVVVRSVFVALVAQTFMRGVLGVLYAPLAIERLGMGGAGVGILSAAYGGGTAVAAVALSRLLGAGRLGVLVSVGVAVWGGAVALLALPTTAAGAVLVVLAIGAGNGLFDLAAYTMLQRSVPDALRAGVFGMFEVTVVVGAATGAASAPLLLAGVGFVRTCVAAGAVGVLAALVTVATLRRADRQDAVPDAWVDLLGRSPVFALLSRRAVGVLALRARERHASPGEVLMRRGDPGDVYMVIIDGSVEVDVDDHLVAHLASPEGFGEIALLREEARTANVVAVTDVHLLVIDRGAFRAATNGRDGGLLERRADENLSHPAHRRAP